MAPHSPQTYPGESGNVAYVGFLTGADCPPKLACGKAGSGGADTADDPPVNTGRQRSRWGPVFRFPPP